MSGVPAAPAAGNTTSPKTASPKIVYQVDFRDDIGPPSWREAQAALRQARYMKADVILINMNGFNGSLETADNIRRNLLQFDKPVMVYLDKPTTGAGTLISLAGDSIYMNPKSRMGSATVKDKSGKPAPGNYQRYMRSLLHHTAEATSHNPATAAAMNGISHSISLNAREAQQNNMIEGQAASVDDVLRLSGYEDYKLVRYTPGTYERLINLLLTPAFTFLLLCSIGLCMLRAVSGKKGIFPALLMNLLLALPFFGAYYEDGRTGLVEILAFAGISLSLVIMPHLSRNVRRISAAVLLLLVVFILSSSRVETHAAFDPAALYQTGELVQTLLITGGAFALAALIRWFAPLQRLSGFLRQTDGSPDKTIEFFAAVPAKK